MPPIWGWILVYLLGFVLFQAVLYWYLRDDGTSLDSTTPGYVNGDVQTLGETEPLTDTPDDGTVRCRHCGAHNESEPGYRYCRQCTRELT